MKRQRRIIVDELFFTVSRSAQSRRDRVRVEVENVEAKDKPMANALAEVLCIWLNATRRPA